MKTIFKFIIRTIQISMVSLFVLGILTIIYLESQLPSVASLKEVQFQVPLRVYSTDGKLIAEYGEKRCTPIKIKDVPKTLINAILATEDVRFYTHPGVDLKGLIRATVLLAINGQKSQGGSTITMQVARNFFLSRNKTYLRKINEILLALKIEKALSKQEILELYLNKIYFGKRAYGVSAAAEVYYGTSLDKLTLAQMATIAGIPQSPSTINPLYDPKASLQRREHVLKRMLNYDLITAKEYKQAKNEPSTARYHGSAIELDAPYVAEIVRQKLFEVYGDKAYDQGLKVYTSVISKYQEAANNAVINGVLEYDKRHGFRKSKIKFDLPKKIKNDSETQEILTSWLKQLKEIPKFNMLEPAVVVANFKDKTHVMLKSGAFTDIDFKYMRWAGPALKDNKVGKRPSSPAEVVKPGDVIYVLKNQENDYILSQLPKVEGSLVALDPKTGAILSLVGGFNFYKSRFNRIVQAERQPGSNFKPFIYSAAIENGFTAATVINDAPIVEADPSKAFGWRPQNHTRQFYGPTRLRVGLAKSINLVTIKLLKAVGLEKSVLFLKAFGFDDAALPKSLSLALGTGSMTPLELAAAYSTFPNGGFKINPFLINRILDYKDKVIFEQKPTVICSDCTQILAANKDTRIAQQVISPQTAYIMSSILKDTIKYGTGKLANSLKREDLSGKTGTTSDHCDVWFTGFNQQIVATTWMGFDDPRTISEYSSTTSLPMWIAFMETVLKDMPEIQQPMPGNLVTVKIDPITGYLAQGEQKNAIYEIFTADTVPKQYAPNTNSYLAPDNTGDVKQSKDESLF